MVIWVGKFKMYIALHNGVRLLTLSILSTFVFNLFFWSLFLFSISSACCTFGGKYRLFFERYRFKKEKIAYTKPQNNITNESSQPFLVLCILQILEPQTQLFPGYFGGPLELVLCFEKRKFLCLKETRSKVGTRANIHVDSFQVCSP